ncbi:MAG: hypothetical protein F6K47_05640 [Symploca sp. SIO2E6]|nr:hypothetical protein [Symploca sp. SIO2E6]
MLTRPGDVGGAGLAQLSSAHYSLLITHYSCVECPIFSFRYLDKTHGLDSCNKDEKVALVSTLYKLSQFSWKDLRNAPRHGVLTRI